MKLLVTGSCGMLGYEVAKEAINRGHKVIATDLSNIVFEEKYFCVLDISDKSAVNKTIRESGADAVVHCAAWTAVDTAEDPALKDKVYAVNVFGTQNVAHACREVGAKLIYISTDYVFDGSGVLPHTADDTNFAPVNEYGKSKLAGENAIRNILDRYFIVRTSWLFGNGRNFVATMIDCGNKWASVRVIEDQVGTPTYALDLARLLVDMAETEKYGCYNAVNSGGYISWYIFCKEIYRLTGITAMVVPVTTAEYGESTAMRPLNSRLDTCKLEESGFQALPHWQDALRRYLRSIGKL